ncbi:MAG: LPS export ABC transporter periplasmic protein LptC [Candidatus Omnitrophica bacterium]|nr:LPS export ABC transporter periplasmic protein LptC [Candidatus Omnitrophota bacterium]
MFKRCGLVFSFVFLMVFVLEARGQENLQEADQQINDFSLAGYGDKGKKTWDLSAKSADIFTEVVKLKDIIGNIYEEKEDVNLTADRGDFDKIEGKVHLEQNVIITSSSGARLTTDSLDWDRKNKIVTTKDVVNIEKDNLFSTASGATGQPDLNKVTLEKDVTVEVSSIKNQGQSGMLDRNKTIITCDGPLQIDYEKNVAVFNNNVNVDSQTIGIDCDIMDVYFTMSDEDTNKDTSESGQTPTLMGSSIEKIIARGNVKITRGDNISYSDEAVYSALDKRITLVGRPKLIISSTEDLDASFGN